VSAPSGSTSGLTPSFWDHLPDDAGLRSPAGGSTVSCRPWPRRPPARLGRPHRRIRWPTMAPPQRQQGQPSSLPVTVPLSGYRESFERTPLTLVLCWASDSATSVTWTSPHRQSGSLFEWQAHDDPSSPRLASVPRLIVALPGSGTFVRQRSPLGSRCRARVRSRTGDSRGLSATSKASALVLNLHSGRQRGSLWVSGLGVFPFGEDPQQPRGEHSASNAGLGRLAKAGRGDRPLSSPRPSFTLSFYCRVESCFRHSTVGVES
jgi:hypothetical protein